MVHFIEIRTDKFVRAPERGRPGQVNGNSSISHCTIRIGITGEIERPNSSYRSENISDGFMYIISQKL
jgi:hypothetical protein